MGTWKDSIVPLRIVAYWKLNDGDTWRRCILNRDKQVEKGARNPLNNWYLSWTCVTEFANVHSRGAEVAPWALAFAGFPALRIAARPTVRMYSKFEKSASIYVWSMLPPEIYTQNCFVYWVSASLSSSNPVVTEIKLQKQILFLSRSIWLTGSVGNQTKVLLE